MSTGTLLDGKTALVTGGTKGIGRDIVLALADAGAQVVACYRGDEDAAHALRSKLKAMDDRHAVVRADVTDAGQVRELVAGAPEQIDIVVHNAGTISHVPFGELDEPEWHRVVDTSLTGAYLVIRTCLPKLGPDASIVAVGSRVATVGIPLRAHYTAAKAGLIGLVRSLGKELGGKGVRVNVVAPGVIETPVADDLPEEVRRRYEGMTALRRIGRGHEVANVVTFLAGPQSSYVTGEVIHVDGGI